MEDNIFQGDYEFWMGSKPNYVHPTEIYTRLVGSMVCWTHKNDPEIKIIGEDNSFGHLVFDFGVNQFKMKIFVRNAKGIVDNALHAWKTFKAFMATDPMTQLKKLFK